MLDPAADFMVQKSHYFPLIASITGVLAFVMFCGCGGLLVVLARKVGSKSSEGASIQHIIEMDHKLSSENVNGTTAGELAKGVRTYVTKASALDLSSCPAEFRLAYRRHLEAWSRAGSAIDDFPDGFVDAVFLGALNSTLRGELDGGQSRLEGKIDASLEHVRSTWYAVEDVAVKYGVAH